MDASRQEFTVSMDTTNRLLTGFVLLTMVACVTGLALAGSSVPFLRLAYWPIAGALALFLPIMALFAPRKYIVTPTEIIVWRRGPKVVIPRDKISAVEPVKLKGVIRTFGVGGFMGSWGRFWSKDLGSFRAYVTRGDRAVAIRDRVGKTIVLSPDDPDGFVELLTSVALAASTADTTVKPDADAATVSLIRILAFIAVALTLPVIAVSLYLVWLYVL